MQFGKKANTKTNTQIQGQIDQWWSGQHLLPTSRLDQWWRGSADWEQNCRKIGNRIGRRQVRWKHGLETEIVFEN